MALIKYKLGDLITQSSKRNRKNKYSNVVGISTQKTFIKTKADLDGVKLTNYRLVNKNEFAYVPDTSRRGDKISLAFNMDSEILLVSSISIIFKVKREDILLPEYLYIYFNRPEFDRYSRFNSWGSARETFAWEDMCDIEIQLPPIKIQQKYVDIYKSILENQKNYECGLEDLKLVCDGYIDHLKKVIPVKAIGEYIQQLDNKNDELKYDAGTVKGISIAKKFIPTKADMKGVSLKSYNIVNPSEFAYVTVTSRNGEKISIAHNNSYDTHICSSSYVVFGIKNKEKLVPGYLSMFFGRDEFDRYARYNSWGSARETFDWDEMCEVKIPIPPIQIQQNIVDIYDVYISRRRINEKLKLQIKDICPILIKGSLDEASA